MWGSRLLDGRGSSTQIFLPAGGTNPLRTASDEGRVRTEQTPQVNEFQPTLLGPRGPGHQGLLGVPEMVSPGADLLLIHRTRKRSLQNIRLTYLSPLHKPMFPDHMASAEFSFSPLQQICTNHQVDLVPFLYGSTSSGRTLPSLLQRDSRPGAAWPPLSFITTAFSQA